MLDLGLAIGASEPGAVTRDPVLAEAVEHVRRVAQDKGKKAAIFCADGPAAG